MAKKKKKQTEETDINNFQQDLDDFLGNSLKLDVKTLSEIEQVPFWIHSGSYALNWVISDDMFKGIPGGKITLISGEEAKGKSLLSDIILGNNIKHNKGISYKLDVEDASAGDFTSKVIGEKEIANQIRLISPSIIKEAKRSKGDISKLKSTNLVITIEKLTTLLNKLVDFQLSKGDDKVPSIVVSVDSVSQLSSDKETEDVSNEKDTKDMTAQQKVRALFRVINQKMREAKLTIVGIAHLTTNIGVMFGDKKTISAKGSGFKYSSSLIINMVSSKEILDPETDTPIGVRMKLKTTKNRLTYKGRESFLYMYFNYGIDEYGGLSELLTKFKIVKASSDPKKDGSFSDSTKFTYECEDGAKLKWKATEIKKVIEEYGKDKLLEEWNRKLTQKYQDLLNFRDSNEQEYIEMDEIEDDILDQIDEDIEDEK